MTLFVGIDESYLQTGITEEAFIYVGTLTKNDAFAKDIGKSNGKIRNPSDHANFDLKGLDGFLFGIFKFDNYGLDRSLRRREKSYRSVLTLLKESLDGASLLGILGEKEDVHVEIDGHDSFRMNDPLYESLATTEYGGRTKITFIAQGDQRVKLINRADMLAYVLRELRGIEAGIEKDLGVKGLAALKEHRGNPRIRNITPAHIGNKLERIAA